MWPTRLYCGAQKGKSDEHQPVYTTTLITAACRWKENDAHRVQMKPPAWQKSPSTVVQKPTKASAELRLMWFPNESEPLGGITLIFKVGHHPHCRRSSSMRSFFSLKVLPGHFGHITCRLWYNNVIIRWPAWLSCRITPWPHARCSPAQPVTLRASS